MMKQILPVILLLGAAVFSSCGPENDAKDVCSCFHEALRTKDGDEDEKLKECIELLNKYTEKHKENGTLEEFNEAYHQCQ